VGGDLTERGITNEDAMLRFYHRYLGLEVFIGIGLAVPIDVAGAAGGLPPY